MNVGLLYTPVSIYQMTRGALVLFVGVLSVVFLQKRLKLFQYVNRFCFLAFRSSMLSSGRRCRWFSSHHVALHAPEFISCLASISFLFTIRKQSRTRPFSRIHAVHGEMSVVSSLFH